MKMGYEKTSLKGYAGNFRTLVESKDRLFAETNVGIQVPRPITTDVLVYLHRIRQDPNHPVDKYVKMLQSDIHLGVVRLATETIFNLCDEFEDKAGVQVNNGDVIGLVIGGAYVHFSRNEDGLWRFNADDAGVMAKTNCMRALKGQGVIVVDETDYVLPPTTNAKNEAQKLWTAKKLTVLPDGGWILRQHDPSSIEEKLEQSGFNALKLPQPETGGIR